MSESEILNVEPDIAMLNVEKMFGTYDEYRKGLTGRKSKRAEKQYLKLVNDERKRLGKEKAKIETGKLKAVRDVLIESYPGQSIMRKVKVLSGERLKDPFNPKNTFYTGIVPHVIEIHSEIIPSWLARKFLPVKFRVRGHYKLYDQPFTRDFYTGEILNYEKQQKVLLEQGFIDADGFLLTKEGARMEIKGCYVKVDVSQVDFITAEAHAYEQSKNDQHMAQAMAKTGKSSESMWMWIIIAFIAGIVLNTFILTGGFG